jgi:hypothetical protein
MREYVPAPVGQRTASSRPRLFVFESRDGDVEVKDIDELMNECLVVWSQFCATLPLQGTRHTPSAD